MRRYGLRDDQWERIKDFLPGSEGHVGVRRKIIDCSLKRCSIDTELAVLGVIYPSVSVIGNRCTSASADGRRAGFSSAFSKHWRAITITNT